MAQYSPKITYVPFTGEVEDNNDPLKIGRVRVRVHGHYSSDENEVPTENLPWAHVNYPSSRAIYPPDIGEWVTGYFIDGEEMQRPVVWGVLPGMSFEEDEPNTNRFARNEKAEDTDQYEKREDITEGYDSLEEPETDYNAEYPFNFSFETRSGHLIEIDDTEGSERINIFHRTGSYREFQNEGQVNDKAIGERYTITLEDDNLIIKQNRNVEIDKEDNLYIGGNKDTTIEGNNTTEIQGNEEITVEGNETTDIKGNQETNVQGDQTTSVTGSIEMNSSTGDITLKTAAGQFNLNAAGRFSLNSVGGELLNVIDAVNSLAQALLNLQTIGAPSQHVIDPATATKIGQVITQITPLLTGKQ